MAKGINIHNSNIIPPDAPLTGRLLSEYSAVYDMVMNNGYSAAKIEEGDKVEISYGTSTFHDMVMSSDLVRFIPKVVTNILVSSIAPRMVIAKYLFKHMAVDNNVQVNVGAIGPLQAQEIPEGGPWTMQTPHFDGGDMIRPAHYRRFGLMLGLSEDAMKIGSLEIVKLFLLEAGKALALKKEEIAMDAIETSGITLFDNTGGTSYFGATEGRNISGAYNGTWTLNDIIKADTYMNMANLNPKIMLIHPLQWLVLATSPDTREVMVQGGKITSAPSPLGEGSTGFPNPYGVFGLDTESGTGTSEPDNVFGKIGYNPFVPTLNPLNATWFYRNNLLPDTKTIMVSPFVKQNASASIVGSLPTTNVYMIDPEACGVLMQLDSPSMKEHNDFITDAHLIKVGERYGVEIIKQGRGIGIAKGVVVDRCYTFENVNSITITETHPKGPYSTE